MLARGIEGVDMVGIEHLLYRRRHMVWRQDGAQVQNMRPPPARIQKEDEEEEEEEEKEEKKKSSKKEKQKHRIVKKKALASF